MGGLNQKSISRVTAAIQLLRVTVKEVNHG